MIKSSLEKTGIVAILRGIHNSDIFSLIEALYNGGIRLAEVTMNTDGALSSIESLRKLYGNSMYIGAGTVTDLKKAQQAIDAGAQFIVTPNINADVIELCLNKNILILPGAFTPTEICTAMRLGCEYVKLFPAGCLGTDYMKSVLAPLDDAKLIAVGGINAENAADYLNAGAVGLGIGGSLCKIPKDGDYRKITKTAEKLIAILPCP